MKHSASLGKFSFGMGDRFAHQAKAQLQAVILAAGHGVEVTPVWNKSNREHAIIGSRPASVRLEKTVACGRRPHPAGHGGRLSRFVGLLHH
jgi:hypothetical protein